MELGERKAELQYLLQWVFHNHDGAERGIVQGLEKASRHLSHRVLQTCTTPAVLHTAVNTLVCFIFCVWFLFFLGATLPFSTRDEERPSSLAEMVCSSRRTLPL